LAWDEGKLTTAPSRKAKFVVIDPQNDAYEGLVSLSPKDSSNPIQHWKKIELGQPGFQLDEFSLIEECVKKDPGVM
jgi:Cu2+-containing amine oxidase